MSKRPDATRKIGRAAGIAIVLAALLSPNLPAADEASVGKSVFTAGYPQALSFRGEYVGAYHRNYATWSQVHDHRDGVLRKY